MISFETDVRFSKDTKAFFALQYPVMDRLVPTPPETALWHARASLPMRCVGSALFSHFSLWLSILFLGFPYCVVPSCF